MPAPVRGGRRRCNLRFETLEAFAQQRMQQLRQRMLEEAVDGVSPWSVAAGRSRSGARERVALRGRTAAHGRAKTFRRLDAPEVLADVASGVVYVNGVRAVNRRHDKVAAGTSPSCINASLSCLVTP